MLHLVAVLILANVLTIAANAQPVTLKGTVTDATTKVPVSAASVVVKGSTTGTYTDEAGNFTITTSQPLPITLEISAVNYQNQSVVVSAASGNISITLEQTVALGQEVVVSATRTPARILESPVSIERVGTTAIRGAAAANYYDMINNLKGVDVVTSSLTFKTPATRGFNGSGNTRVNQIMDGMDNQAPGLNFSVGSIIGLTELDVDNFELLQGASSALYGPGGMNGTILINGKSPFKYPGLSFQIKTGMMHFNDKGRDVSPYYNWAVRWGQKVSDKFAFKIGAELVQAKDWLARDYRNYLRQSSTTGKIVPGTRETDPNYDGANVYGDEASTNMRSILDIIGGNAFFASDFIKTLPTNIPVSRTGYTENEMINPNTYTFKLTGALHYKLAKNVEAILAANWGTGNSVYTGSQRYSLKDFKIGQYKLDIVGKNWYVRGYTTQENSGNSSNLTFSAIKLNEAWKSNTAWFTEYTLGYLNAKLAGKNEMDAHNIARGIADVGRPAAGSQQFKDLMKQVTSKPIPVGGQFVDRSDLYMAEGQYSFEQIKFADIMVGGNWKQYVLNSQGTLFADKAGEPITINEVGAYIQVAKSFLNEKLRLSASGRYDKNENFEGRFTPRVTALYKVAKSHNLRFSYQTAYRFPSTQQQWIDLDVVTGRLLGENIALWEKYNLINNAPYNPLDLSERITYVKTKPESVTSFELGYKSVIKSKLMVDVYGYVGEYQNFLSRRDAIQFASGVPAPNAPYSAYSVVVNAPGKVKTYGWGASFDYLLPKGFTAGLNLSSDILKDVPEGFRANFNAPKLRTNVSVGNTGFGKKKLVGFNLVWKWQDGFFYESDFIQDDLPAFHNVDASINIKSPRIRSLIKIGANNLLNSYYRNAVANPMVGGLYYVSFAYNVL